MIRPLRNRHRATFAALAVALPIGLVAAIASRETRPVQSALPAALAAPQSEWPNARALGRLWPELDVDARQLGNMIELAPGRDFRFPDVLVYFATEAASGEDLPEGAVLLGKLSAGGDAPQRFFLSSQHLSGHLILFSLGHYTVIGSAEVRGSW